MVDDLVAFVHSSAAPNPLYQKLFDLNESIERKKLDYVLKKAPTLEDDVLKLMESKHPKMELPSGDTINDIVRRAIRWDNNESYELLYDDCPVLPDYLRDLLTNQPGEPIEEISSVNHSLQRINYAVGILMDGNLTNKGYQTLLELEGDELLAHLKKNYIRDMSISRFLGENSKKVTVDDSNHLLQTLKHLSKENFYSAGGKSGIEAMFTEASDLEPVEDHPKFHLFLRYVGVEDRYVALQKGEMRHAEYVVLDRLSKQNDDNTQLERLMQTHADGDEHKIKDMGAYFVALKKLELQD
jgi:hypothetical protein